MSSKSMVNRATVSDSNLDRISDLPDGVIENILKRLPLHEAVRTSILSRPWRYKWVTLPDLDFVSWRCSLSLFEDSNWEAESIVDGLLARHEGPIVKFKFTSPNATVHPAMDRWIHFLLDHPIEYLELSWLFLGLNVDHPLLPSPLFSFDHLKHLCLREVKVTPPPEYSGLSKIINLELWRVKIEHKELETIISRCPLLVCLKLINCIDTELWCLNIDALNLKGFQLHGKFSAISFRNASIEEISITQLFANFEFRGRRRNWFEVFNQFPSVKRMSLNGEFLQCLALGGALQKLPSDLDHLTFLCFDDFEWEAMDLVSRALCLIRSSPNLQSLYISSEVYGGEGDTVIEYLKAQQKCIVPLGCLKNVRVFMSDLESELEFVKLILLWATELEKLEIKTSFRSAESDGDPDDQDDFDKVYRSHELLKKIASFSRASSKAVLLFNGSWELLPEDGPLSIFGYRWF